MAFPVIQTADTKNGTQASNSASWTGTYPTNIAAGDLLLLFIGCDGGVSASVSGFLGGNTQGSANSLGVLKKSAAGSESGNFTISLGGSEQGGWRIFRITGWGGNIGTTFDNAATTGDVAGDWGTAGASNAPDPPSLDPANWGTEDTLWFAICSLDTSRTISVFPLADNNSSDVSGGSTGATLGVCTTSSAVSSLDPSTFTISASDDWLAGTIAVRPQSSAVPRNPAAVLSDHAVMMKKLGAIWKRRPKSGIYLPEFA